MALSILPFELRIPSDEASVNALWVAHNLTCRQIGNDRNRYGTTNGGASPVDRTLAYRLLILNLILTSPDYRVSVSRCAGIIALRDQVVDTKIFERVWADLGALMSVISIAETRRLGLSSFLTRWASEGR